MESIYWNFLASPDLLADLEMQCFKTPWQLKDYQELFSKTTFKCWIINLPISHPSSFLAFYQIIPEIEILRMGVVPDQRCSGLGSFMLKKLEEYAMHNQIKTLWLDVHIKNALALKLYYKIGFTEINRRKDYYLNPPGDALILKKDVRK